MNNLFDVNDQVIVITGGAGVLGSDLARALYGLGAKIAILDLNEIAGDELVVELHKKPGQAISLKTNILEEDSIAAAADEVVNRFGRIDCLINAGGGNHPKATTGPDLSFFDVPKEAFQFVSDLNLLGTVLPSQVIGKIIAKQESGIILNISSMNAFRPLTRIPAYSAAKAAVSNFTQWLAVHLAQEYSPKIRVNAIAPGFFLTNQNRFLLTDEKTGELTTRGKQIIDHTPQGRFGDPEDLIGTVVWLLSPASIFITGVVVPVDGGFSAFSGV
ncbi:MAG: SDR family oxidoreductase [Candidatus Marinimicrobia bacterium]|nr:SDR family oxidoreductase [Candidatus Neomarinimicrobiota bacterium]